MRQIPDRYGCRHIDLGPCELSYLEVRRPFMLDRIQNKTIR